MADRRIDGLSALAAAPASGDLFVVQDVSDTTDQAQGTYKKMTAADAFSALATDAELASHESDTTNIHGITDTSLLIIGGDNGGKTLEDVGAIKSRVTTVAASGSTETLDASVTSVFKVTMDQNCTFTFSNPAPSGECSVIVLALSGAYTPTFPASVDWGDATPPTYTTPSEYTFMTIDGGTIWTGAQRGKAFG